MKAIGAIGTTPSSLREFETEKPALRPHDLLIKVEGISVNPVDKWIRKGAKDAMDNPVILGWDGIGIVVETGKESKLFEIGDKVFWAGDVTRAGSNAQFQAVDERVVGHAPQNVTEAEAVALPLTGLTAYEALFEKMHITEADKGKSILIINGSGGVGSIATQLAKKVAQLKVISTASTPEAIAWVKGLGADFTVDHHQKLVPQVRELGFENVNYILILNAVDAHIAEATELIAPQGHIANIVEPRSALPLGKLAHKSASFDFEWMYTKVVSDTKNIATQHDILNQIAAWLDDGTICSTISENIGAISVENLIKAHKIIDKNHTIGKIVLTGELK